MAQERYLPKEIMLIYKFLFSSLFQNVQVVISFKINKPCWHLRNHGILLGVDLLGRGSCLAKLFTFFKLLCFYEPFDFLELLKLPQIIFLLPSQIHSKFISLTLALGRLLLILYLTQFVQIGKCLDEIHCITPLILLFLFLINFILNLVHLLS